MAPTQQGAQANGKRPSVLQRAWNAYETGLNSVVGWFGSCNYKLGTWTNQHPLIMVIATLVITTCICIGWVRFYQETEADVLWVPQTGKARNDKAYVESYYPRTRQGASFYSQLQPKYWSSYGGNNALQIPVTWEMFQLHSAVMAINVTNAQGLPVSFTDLCAKTRTGGCSRGGYLNFWGYNFTNFVNSVGGSFTDPTQGNQTTFRTQVWWTDYVRVFSMQPGQAGLHVSCKHCTCKSPLVSLCHRCPSSHTLMASLWRCCPCLAAPRLSSRLASA